MKSLAVTKDLKLEVVEVPEPELTDESAILKTLSCGLCNGTDIKIAHGTFKGFDTYPCLLGHEAIGEVIEVGKKVKRWKVGDRVMLPYLETGPDGTYHGYYSGWCAFSEYTVARDWVAMAEMGIGPGTEGFFEGYYTQKILPPDIDPVYGAMINTFREVLAAYRDFGIEPNHSVVLFGAGPVGLTFTRVAKLMGASKVIMVHNKNDRREEALRLGADHYVNSAAEDVVETVKKALPGGADHVIDAVGVNSIINTGMRLVKNNGQIGVYGISSTLGMDLDWAEGPYNWNLKFLQFPKKADEAAAHDQVINWIRLRALSMEDFVSHVIPFENILEAFDIVEKKKPRKKIIISY